MQPRRCSSSPAAPFVRKYSANDIELLVEMDRANEDVCGPATVHLVHLVHLVQRAWSGYGDARYERLAGLSVGHLYNLRKSARYQARRRHITCANCVSQWQLMAGVQAISEAYLLPVLALIMAQFPFMNEGFHCDNGSEFINGKVARLLEKRRIEQTRSRPRQSNDNPLAESKNASVVRKHMGYSHIPQRYAAPSNAFSVPTFKPGMTVPALPAQGAAQTDLAAAHQMQRAKANLFELFNKTRTRRQA